MRGHLRTYYESPKYECEGKPGTYAAITITGDHEGPHFIFSTGDEIILDLPIPACEALAIAYALSRSGKRTIRANEREEAAAAERAYSADDLAPFRPPAVPAPAERAALPRAASRFMERVPAYSPPAAWAGPNGRNAA